MSEQKRVRPKPITPYQRLLETAKELAFSVMHPKRVHMWTYPKNKLAGPWNLQDLMQRVDAADQLGYDVRLYLAEDGLRVEYIKRPDVPWELR